MKDHAWLCLYLYLGLVTSVPVQERLVTSVPVQERLAAETGQDVVGGDQDKDSESIAIAGETEKVGTPALLEDDSMRDVDIIVDDQVSTLNTDISDEADEVVDPYVARCRAKANAAIKKLQVEEQLDGEVSSDSLYSAYGVHSEQLEQPLLVGAGKSLHYRVLLNTPHGRHLLLISLLEQLSMEMWTARCGGKLRVFLPSSLKSSDQPDPAPEACVLDNIVNNNRVLHRVEVMDKLDRLVPSEMYTKMFSWYDEKHRQVVNSLA